MDVERRGDAADGDAVDGDAVDGEGEDVTERRPALPVAEALGLSPSDVGRAALNRAKAAARSRGLRPGSPGVSRPVAEQRSGPARARATGRYAR